MDWAKRNWWKLLAAGVVYVCILLFSPEPRIRHSSALNAVFDSRWLLAGARMVLAAAMLYLVASIVVRVENRQWVRSAGSVATDEGATQQLTDDRRDLREQLREARATIKDLTTRLDNSLSAREHELDKAPGGRDSATVSQVDQGGAEHDDDP